MNGFFVTGTDTGVGKTFVAAGIIRAIKAKGISVCPMKPVESGCCMKKGELFPPDAIALLKASGVDETIDVVNPYRFRNPVAPAAASELENVKIEKKKIIAGFKRLSKKYDLMIVEGAGGIMVPVYKRYLFLDLAVDMDLPLLIVSRPGLGTINHTLLTIEAARNRGLNIAGVVINYSKKQGKDMSEKTNPDMIKRLGKVPLLGIVPYSNGSNNDQLNTKFKRIAKKILQSFCIKPELLQYKVPDSDSPVADS